MAGTFPLAPTIASALEEYRLGLEILYRDRLCRVILFGSRARGDAGRCSDLDVALVLRGNVDVGEEIVRTSRLRQQICLKHELLISSIYISERDWREKRSPLLANIRREGIDL